jgi:hypothetical protein
VTRHKLTGDPRNLDVVLLWLVCWQRLLMRFDQEHPRA